MVIWVLSLTALAAFFTFAITLGNLVQSGVNVQGAADAAALAGASTWGRGDQAAAGDPRGPAAHFRTRVRDVVQAYSLDPAWNTAACPAPPAGFSPAGFSHPTALGDADGSTGCIFSSPEGVVWACILDPQPGALGGHTVMRNAAAYVGPAGTAVLCGVSTCPAPVLPIGRCGPV
ncbi:MAG: pilus assembly protein TadG-related protein [Acidimicrobiales bacterium]